MASISGRLTLDQNRDFTERDGSGGFDTGIQGVFVQLLNEQGQVVATTTTDATGRYTFDGLVNGFYAIKVPTSIGDATLAPDNRGGDINSDSDAFADGKTATYQVPAGSNGESLNEIDVSYGFYNTGGTGSLGQDGIVDGTNAGDTIAVGTFTDADGDVVTANNDIIFGNGGNDQIFASTGDDRAEGGTGQDFVAGEDGNDTLFGDNSDGRVGEGLPNLIVNGSFEDTTGLTAQSFGFTGTGGIPGWTAISASDVLEVYNVNSEAVNNGGTVASDGSNALDMGESPGNIGIFQDVPNLLAGEIYRLNFDLYDSPSLTDTGANSNAVEVFFGGQLVGVFNPANTAQWQTFSANLVGGSGDGSDRLEFRGLGPEDDIGVGLDNIILQPFSAPAIDAALQATSNDGLDGGAGNDLLVGGVGSDNIVGGTGNDTIFGDNGDADTRVFGYETPPNLIYNGSFENIDGLRQTSTGFAGDGAVPGWVTVEPNQAIEIFNFNPETPNAASEGDFALDLGASPGNITVFQDVQNLVAGETYSLSFDLSDSANLVDTGSTSNAVEVFFGGVSQGVFNPVNGAGYQNFSLDLVAGSGDGTDRLQFVGLGAEDNIGVGLDNVQLLATSDAGLAAALAANAGDDTISGGAGDDLIYANAGNDLVFGGDGNDTIRGREDNDTLNGEAGNDNILGEDGDDLISGGAGADFLAGDAGNDTITVASAAEGAGDSIFGGAEGTADNDVLDLRGAGPVTITQEADPNDPDATRGTVTFSDGSTLAFEGIETILSDPDGVVDGAETGEFMPVGYADAQGDVVTDGNDVIFGNGGDDDIRAGGGDDFVSGGVGGDFIDGGAGNDNINGDAGNDDLRGGAGDDQVFGGDGNDFIDGGADNDSLNGGAGNDDLRGGTGDDTLVGGEGADQLIGDAGNDTFLVASPAEGAGDSIFGGAEGTTDNDVLDLRGAGPVTITQEADPNDPDATRGTVTFSDGSTLSFEGIETILSDPDGVVDGAETGEFMPVGYADAQGDVVTDGNDVIFGNGGNDDIRAGAGDDFVSGGLGNDFVDGGLGNDNINGDAGNDDLRGDAGDDLLFGGDGTDFLDGGADNDSLNGGAGNDDLRGGTGDDTLVGGEGADQLLAGAGNDSLQVGAGDNAQGEGGDDTFTADPSLTGTTPITVIGGEDGETNGDTLDLRGLGPVTVVYDAADPSFDPATGTGEGGTATYTNANGDPVTITFSEIENVLTDPDGVVDGTPSGDAIDVGFADAEGDVVTEGADVIAAGAGNDTVSAGGGNDSVDAGTGDDVVDGGLGNDTLDGGAGNDALTGGAGDDLLDGGAGNDTLAVGGADQALGGDGDDLFQIDPTDPAADVAATITGGENDETLGDTLDLSAQTDGLTLVLGPDGESGTVDGLDTIAGDDDITFAEIETIIDGAGNDVIDASAATGPVALQAQLGDDTLVGGAGADTLGGGVGDDQLQGGDGNDLLDGGDGNDLLTGGDGADTFAVSGGQDTISDFGVGDPAGDGDPTNNDFVDLSPFYSQANYDAAVAAGDIDPTVIKTPLEWLRADLADDGVLNDTGAGWGPDNTLTIEQNGAPIDGALLNAENTGVPCFVRGTAITTMRGQVPVEQLRVGDKVLTRDNGMQEIRWIGSSKVAGIGKLAPIRVAAGVFGPNERDLWLSPNHRLLRTGGELDLYFQSNEIFVAAKHLLQHPGVQQVTCTEVEYFHILFDAHEVILSNGLWSESFHPGHQGMDGFDAETRAEVLYLFPELAECDDYASYGATARVVLKAHEARLLATMWR